MSLRLARRAWSLSLVGAMAAGCGGGGGGGAKIARPTASAVQTERAACGYGAGKLPAETIAADEPVGDQIPIDHIVLIMQENRSFDHYYSELTVPNQTIEQAAETISNPDANGKPVSRFHFTTKCMGGGDHSWNAEHANYDGGKLDGFVKTNDSTTPMGWYDGNDLPFYYALAQSFAISDSHFSSAMAPTWPNRMFYFAGTSYGITDNVFPNNTAPNVLSELDAVNVEWRFYTQDSPTVLIVAPSEYVHQNDRFLPETQFFTDLQAGSFAPVTFVEMSDQKGAASPDEGPPGDIDLGQQFVSSVVTAVMQSPFWKSSAIFISYDENGGMYDHVVPPMACPPDDDPLMQNSQPFTDPNGASFNQYGYRVPFFVVSPYAKRGYVSHEVTDHTSILRFVEARFGMPAMSARDANAAPAYDMFDFAHPDFSVPSLPAVTVDQDALAKCLGPADGGT